MHRFRHPVFRIIQPLATPSIRLIALRIAPGIFAVALSGGLFVKEFAEYGCGNSGGAGNA
jgi:hypothetical protein